MVGALFFRRPLARNMNPLNPSFAEEIERSFVDKELVASMQGTMIRLRKDTLDIDENGNTQNGMELVAAATGSKGSRELNTREFTQSLPLRFRTKLGKHYDKTDSHSAANHHSFC
ncbi:MAG TPA: hypothetical protein VN920_13735 [Pyrinomonadaceae bacterium]|nr:hypothetical protein [Pyrinomonadaceae bacterium]